MAVVIDADPLSRVAVPIGTPPSRNVTFPDGIPDAGATAATVAVIVTDSPNNDGFGAELTWVDVEPWFRVWTTDPVEVTKSPSPE